MSYSSASILFLITTVLTSCYANNLGLDFHHRFSDKVREWTKSRGLPPAWNPEEAPRDSVEYYQALLKHDLHRHRGRSLAAGDLFAFTSGNLTIEYLGNLHYAFVDIGTPNQTFLVALDTGSSLFWVPCNCKQCAPNSYGKIKFSNYKPNASTSSKAISCSSDQCFTTPINQCLNKTADCTYEIIYGSPNTSSSGTIVQDYLYLIKESITPDVFKIPILFGCGEVQTGDLLDGGAPNGLMGLGVSKISVPSVIANNSLLSITDSFSMCFGTDGYGRLNFGNEGSPDQNETSLNINPYGFYNISLTEIVVGNTTSKLPFNALVDSGTSYSGFISTIYKKIATSFSAQVSERPINVKGIPFEYCFEISANQTELKLPPVSFKTKEVKMEARFMHFILLLDFLTSESSFAYCLAILQYDINIVGENFLLGQQIVFDREKQVLGWEPYNCSSEHISPASPPPSTPPHMNPPPPPPPLPPTKKNLTIIIIAVAVPVLVITAAIAAVFWLKRNKHKQSIAPKPRDIYELSPIANDPGRTNANIPQGDDPRDNYAGQAMTTSLQSKGGGQVLPKFEKRQFSYYDITRITDGFKRSIGTGGYGNVYLGLLENGFQVAVKARSDTSSQGEKEFLAEAENLTRVHHKNLVSLLGYCIDKNCMALVYEYMQEGNLYDKLKDNARPLAWMQRLRIAYGSALGLEYLHTACNPPLIHRDVKTSNILLNANLEANISDFGLSKAFNNDAKSPLSTSRVVGTLGYLDPEYYTSHQISEKSDVFSFGVVLLEIITGRPPIITGIEGGNLVEWVRRKLSVGDIKSIVDPRMQDKYDVNSVWKVTELACKCTEYASSRRPTMTVVAAELKESLDLELSSVGMHDESAIELVTDVSQDALSEMAYMAGNGITKEGPVVR